MLASARIWRDGWKERGEKEVAWGMVGVDGWEVGRCGGLLFPGVEGLRGDVM